MKNEAQQRTHPHTRSSLERTIYEDRRKAIITMMHVQTVAVAEEASKMVVREIATLAIVATVTHEAYIVMWMSIAIS